jgi:hypothetical protein
MASLQELPDDELDKLFRSSAGEFEPPYNAEDWNSLRQRLDEDDRSGYIARFIYWGLPLLLLLMTSVSLFVQEDDVRPTTKKDATHLELVSATETAKTALPRSNGNSANGSASAESKRADAPAAKTGEPLVATNEKLGSESADKNRVSEKPVEKTASVRSESKPETAAETTTPPAKPAASVGKMIEESSVNTKNKVGSIPKNRLTKTASADGKRTVRTGTVSGLPENNQTVLTLPENGRTVSGISKNRRRKPAGTGTGLSETPDYSVANSQLQKQNRKTAKPLRGLKTPEYPVVTSTETPVSQTIETTSPVLETGPFDLITSRNYITARPPKKPALPTLPELDLEPMLPPVGPKIVAPSIPVIGFPSLSVRLIMAPDLNFVGSSTKAATDLEIGILGEYRFARRFTIQSGVLRSVKRYKVDADAYTKPMHWYGPKYESIDAVCTVLDIPINLRFDFMLNERRRWFISAGSSSYIMRKEAYEYNYPAGTTIPHNTSDGPAKRFCTNSVI